MIKSMKNRMFTIISLSLLMMVSSVQVHALTPTPAQNQNEPIAITGVTIHTGHGELIHNAVITFDNGIITGIGSGNNAPSVDSHHVMNMEGKHVYPGFILPDTSLGLIEVSSVRATDDRRELGNMNPSVRSIIAYNTDSEVIPTLRFNGVLMAQIVTRGALVAGSSSIVQLDAWNWEDAGYSIDDGIHLYWPSEYVKKFNPKDRSVLLEKNPKYDSLIDSLSNLFQNARVYKEGSSLNFKLAATQKLYTQDKTLYIHVSRSREIIAAIGFARKEHIKNIVLIGARDAMEVKDLLLEEKIPVILNRVHGLPRTADDAVNFSYTLPARLLASGIKVGLGAHSRMDPRGGRNLPFIAGTIAAYGLSKEQALTMITKTNAEILGIGDRVGTLALGKDATLFISIGDALDMRTNQIIKAFIQGRDIELEGTQQLLFKRFNRKYAKEASD